MGKGVLRAEFRAEAERLAQVSVKDQAAIIAWHRDIAADARVASRDREDARARADALERLLRLGGGRGQGS
jgi:hypothetical protein